MASQPSTYIPQVKNIHQKWYRSFPYVREPKTLPFWDVLFVTVCHRTGEQLSPPNQSCDFRWETEHVVHQFSRSTD
jgi:hypothetical protein